MTAQYSNDPVTYTEREADDDRRWQADLNAHKEPPPVIDDAELAKAEQSRQIQGQFWRWWRMVDLHAAAAARLFTSVRECESEAKWTHSDEIRDYALALAADLKLLAKAQCEKRDLCRRTVERYDAALDKLLGRIPCPIQWGDSE